MSYKLLDRRTVLKGMGISLSLPLLEAMIPSYAWAQANIARRLAFIYQPNGFVTPGIYLSKAGHDIRFPHTHFESQLTEHFADIQIVGNMRGKYISANGSNPSVETNYGGVKGMGSPQHNGGAFAYLQPIPPTRINSNNGYRLENMFFKKTFDAYIADALPKVGKFKQVGTILGGVYPREQWFFTKDNTPLPLMDSPKAVFDNLISEGTPREVGTQLSLREKRKKKVLDFVLPSIKSLKAKLGSNDKIKLDQYLTSVESVERNISAEEGGGGNALACNTTSLGARVKEGGLNYPKQHRLMMDLMIMAFECDLTRVFNFHLGRHHVSVYGLNGVKSNLQSWHNYTHGGAAPPGYVDNINMHMEIEKWQAQQFAYLISELKKRVEGDGQSILEKSLLVHAASMSNTNTLYESLGGHGKFRDDYRNTPLAGAYWKNTSHWFEQLAVFIAGGGGGLYPRSANNTLRKHDMKNEYNHNLWYTIMRDFIGDSVKGYGEFNRYISEIHQA